MIVTAVSGIRGAHAANSTASPGEAKTAPAEFKTPLYGLTFRVPRSATYCPLPKDWIGSDHGTTIFLEKFARCDGAGYPSSSRSVEPDDIANISIYYDYRMGEDERPAPRCHGVGTILFLGARRAVCEERDGRRITRWVTARYRADIEAEATLTLTTRANRLPSDMAVFTRTAQTVRTCKSVWRERKGRFAIGQGPLCPKAARWF